MDKQILNNAITILTTHTESNGLTSEQIGRLVDVLVLSNGLDRGSESRIIGSLFPNAKIDEDIAVKIIGCLGLGEQRASLQTQVCLINYVIDAGIVIEMASHGISVLDVSESSSSTLWSDFQLSPLCVPQVRPVRPFLTNRRYIAHLLFLLTTRSHVKTYRIQAMYSSVFSFSF